jgi:hypothetical protein
MGGILGAFQIEDNHHRWLGTAVDELLNEGLGHALEIPGRWRHFPDERRWAH